MKYLMLVVGMSCLVFGRSVKSNDTIVVGNRTLYVGGINRRSKLRISDSIGVTTYTPTALGLRASSFDPAETTLKTCIIGDNLTTLSLRDEGEKESTFNVYSK